MLAVLSVLHIVSSTLEWRESCQSRVNAHSVGESLLNSRPENYDRFEEVLVNIFLRLPRWRFLFSSINCSFFISHMFIGHKCLLCIFLNSINHCVWGFFVKVTEVFDNVSGSGRCPGDSDGEIWHEQRPSWASESDEDSEFEQKTCQIATLS